MSSGRHGFGTPSRACARGPGALGRPGASEGGGKDAGSGDAREAGRRSRRPDVLVEDHGDGANEIPAVRSDLDGSRLERHEAHAEMFCLYR